MAPRRRTQKPTTQEMAEAYCRPGVGKDAIMFPVGDGVQPALDWMRRSQRANMQAQEKHGAAASWQLHMQNAAKEWVEVGTFGTVTDAARRIREMEGRDSGGIFLEMHVEIDFGTDDDAFAVLHHTGKRGLYGIRRARAN